MDRTRGTNKGIGPKRQGQGQRYATKAEGRGHVEASYLRQRKDYYNIHPEWVSENFSVQPISISSRMSGVSTYSPERRCNSAPPARTRNPITWENPDMNEIRLRDIRIRSDRGRPKTKSRPKSEIMDSVESQGEKKSTRTAKFNIKGTFFVTTNSPRRQYYTINPEWQSETVTARKVPLMQSTFNYPPRRCKSAPPPRTRNPITWDFADRPSKR